jgi:hypothetical protein
MTDALMSITAWRNWLLDKPATRAAIIATLIPIATAPLVKRLCFDPLTAETKSCFGRSMCSRSFRQINNLTGRCDAWPKGNLHLAPLYQALISTF